MSLTQFELVGEKLVDFSVGLTVSETRYEPYIAAQQPPHGLVHDIFFTVAIIPGLQRSHVAHHGNLAFLKPPTAPLVIFDIMASVHKLNDTMLVALDDRAFLSSQYDQKIAQRPAAAFLSGRGEDLYAEIAWSIVECFRKGAQVLNCNRVCISIRDDIARKRFGTAVQRITFEGGGKTVSAIRCEAS